MNINRLFSREDFPVSITNPVDSLKELSSIFLTKRNFNCVNLFHFQDHQQKRKPQ